MFIEILPENQRIPAFRLNARLVWKPIFGYFLV